MADRERAERGSRGERGASAPDTLSAMARQQPPAPVKAAPAPASGIEMRAKEPGFYHGNRIRTGQKFFLVPGDKPAKWMEEAR